MIITFILGNGFDIQLGLSSRYSDFLHEYIQITPDDNDNIKNYKKYLAQEKNQKLWSDAERAMGVYLRQYSDATIEAYNERIKNFESSMVKYLKQQQERCSYSDSNQIATRFAIFLFKSFSDALTHRRNDLNVNREEQNIYHFISFNYTNLLEEIKKCCVSNSATIRTRNVRGVSYSDNWGSVFHVHGTLNSQIIMGVNDESQLDLRGGVTLTEGLAWELIKPILNRGAGLDFDITAKKTLSGSDIIAIYGVSYGDTDKLWWEEIVNWLRKNSEHKLVAFIRDTPNRFVPELGWTELIYEKEKRKEILRKLHIEENDPDFDTLIKQIYIILNTTKLNLKGILMPQDLNNMAVAASTDSHRTATI